jgi:hypothetical protein
MTSGKAITKETTGAWIVHHGQKAAADMNGGSEFPALDTAAKAASLLSQLSGTDEMMLTKARVEALAKAARMNPRTELPVLLDILAKKRLIDKSSGGDVAVLGVTSRGTLAHAADIFEGETPTTEERASIELAEVASRSPILREEAEQYIGDKFKLASQNTRDFLDRSEGIGFVDSEGRSSDKLLFNGNLFRRDNVIKARKVLDSLSTAEQAKAGEVDAILAKHGCVTVAEVEKVLTKALFDKLKAAGMYDVNVVSNPDGETAFVTRPQAFHKFVNPMVDDAFDLAKALVAALTYGMTQSQAGRGKITMIRALLNKLIAGDTVGPATAIGEDYKVLEHKGVIRVTRVGYRYNMRLLKRDIGEMALGVLTTGEAASTAMLDKPMPGTMTEYAGPEKNRSSFRRNQSPVSRKHTQDVLNALRTEGGLQ